MSAKARALLEQAIMMAREDRNLALLEMLVILRSVLELEEESKP